MSRIATIADVIAGTARWAVLERDALAVLQEFPACSVDAIITDPPYSSGGQFRGDRTAAPSTKYVQSGSLRAQDPDLVEFSGDNRDQRSFVYWCALWMFELQRIAKPGAILATFTDWRQLPTMTDALQCGGWVWRGIVPWVKPVARPTMGRFTAQCEYVVWGTNGPRALEGTPLPGFYEGASPRQREHITQKPIDVMRGLVKIVEVGGLVFDPFGGSGTTALAAVLEDRRGICCEVVPEHAEIARRRLEAAESGTNYRHPEQHGLFGDSAVMDLDTGEPPGTMFPP